MLSINIFFSLVIQTQLLRNVKQSHQVDLAYLYYLPFCSVFTSKDHFHAQIVPLFMNKRQTFVRGDELKDDLARLVDRYAALPDNVQRTGLITFAHTPRTTPASPLHGYGTFICQAGGHSMITRNPKAILRKIRNSSRKLTDGSTAHQRWSLITSMMWICSITSLLSAASRLARGDGEDFLRSKNKECGSMSNPKRTRMANHLLASH